MANLYWTKDIKKVIEDYIQENSNALVNDKDIPEEKSARYIKELRIFRKYSEELIEKLEQLDREDDERMAKWRAEREAEEEKAKAAEEKPNDE